MVSIYNFLKKSVLGAKGRVYGSLGFRVQVLWCCTVCSFAIEGVSELHPDFVGL